MILKDLVLSLIPSRFIRTVRLKKLNRHFGGGNTIHSNGVSYKAHLSATSEIAADVFIGAYTSIGAYTYIQRGTEILSANIGNFCSIGTDCHIGMYAHPTENVSTSSRLYLKILDCSDYYNDIPKPAVIGHDVWIGSNSTILGGVKIGNGAVIGAGAVVTKDVLPYAVVGGVPAKLIKYRFCRERITELEESQWWNWDVEKIRMNKEFFIKH